MSNEQTPSPKTRLSRSTIGGILIAGAIVAGSIFAVQAIADNRTVQHAVTEVGYRATLHRAGHKHFSDLTDAEIEARVARVVRHIAIEIDATDEQQKKIVALVTALAKEAKPLRENMMASRKQVHDLLLAETIDREALEKMRVERIAEVDQLSKNVVTAVADVAEVLTVEQRRTLEERIREFRGMVGHHRHRRWRD